MEDDFKKALAPTETIDSDHPDIIDFATGITQDTAGDQVGAAVKLYYAVRDGIWYDPYVPFHRQSDYQASRVLKKGRGYCVYKASLLAALARALAIPARVGFADVRNHLATKQLLAHMGTDLFVFHGYVELFLQDRWVKCTPAFNVELCEKHQVEPLEFNGEDDSLFHPYNRNKARFMEYVADHGVFYDIPVDIIVRGWKKAYGRARVEKWIEEYESAGEGGFRDFFHEDAL